MQEDDQLSPQQSLRLIQSMITKTRSNLGENRFYFLLWGWVAFFAILMQFFLKVVMEYRHHYIVWILTVPTAIITIVYSAKQSRRETVKTYAGTSMGYLWMGLGISFFVLSVIISRLPGGWLNGYPFYILFYGLGTFISGKILEFRPLVIGGVFNWILAIACVFVPFDYQLLLSAIAILTSYIIPGHLLKNEII
jgi:hypothetical protein